MAFYKAWTEGAKAYDEADTVADAIEAYRRCRTVKSFILRGDENAVCDVCGRTLADDPAEYDSYKGNRCEYDPRTKTVTVHHYTCGWGVTLTAIANLREHV